MSDNRFDPNKLYTPRDNQQEFQQFSEKLIEEKIYKKLPESGWSLKIDTNEAQACADFIRGSTANGESFPNSPEYKAACMIPGISISALQDDPRAYPFLKLFLARVLFGNDDVKNPIIDKIMRWDQTTFGSFPFMLSHHTNDVATVFGNYFGNVEVHNNEPYLNVIHYNNLFANSMNLERKIAFPGIVNDVYQFTDQGQQLIGYRFSNPIIKAIFFGEIDISKNQNFKELTAQIKELSLQAWQFEKESFKKAAAELGNPIQQRRAEELLALVEAHLKQTTNAEEEAALYDLITFSRILMEDPTNKVAQTNLNKILYGNRDTNGVPLNVRMYYINQGLVNMPWAKEILASAEATFEDFLPNEFANKIQRSDNFSIVKANAEDYKTKNQLGNVSRIFNEVSAQFINQGHIQQALAVLNDILKKNLNPVPTEDEIGDLRYEFKPEFEAWYDYCTLLAIDVLLDENGDIKSEIINALNQNGFLTHFQSQGYDLRGHLIAGFLMGLGQAGSSKLAHEYDRLYDYPDMFNPLQMKVDQISTRANQISSARSLPEVERYLSLQNVIEQQVEEAQKRQKELESQPIMVSEELNPAQQWIERLRTKFNRTVGNNQFTATGFRRFVDAESDFKARFFTRETQETAKSIFETIGALSNPFYSVELATFTDLLNHITKTGSSQNLLPQIDIVLKAIHRRLVLQNLPENHPNRGSDIEYYNTIIDTNLQQIAQVNEPLARNLKNLDTQVQSIAAKVPANVREASTHMLAIVPGAESMRYALWHLSRIEHPVKANNDKVAEIIEAIAHNIALGNNDIVAYIDNRKERQDRIKENIDLLAADPNYRFVAKHLRTEYEQIKNRIHQANRNFLHFELDDQIPMDVFSGINKLEESESKQAVKAQATIMLQRLGDTVIGRLTPAQKVDLINVFFYVNDKNFPEAWESVANLEKSIPEVKPENMGQDTFDTFKLFIPQLKKFVEVCEMQIVNDLIKAEEDLNKTDPAQDILAKSRRLRAIHKYINDIETRNPELATQLRDQLKAMAKPTAKDRWRFTWTDDPERKVWQEMLLLPKFNGPRGLNIFKGIMYGAFILLGGPVILLARNILKSLEGGALELQKLADRGIENLSNYINTPNKPRGLKFLAGIANGALGLFVSYPCKIFRVYSRMITSPIRSATEGNKAGGKPLAFLSGLGSFLSFLGIGLLGGFTVIPAMATSGLPVIGTVGTALQTASTTLGSGASGVVTMAAAEMGKDIVIPAALSPAIGSTIVAAIYSTFVAIKAIGGKIADRIHRKQDAAVPAVQPQQGAQGEGQHDVHHDDRPDREPDVRPAPQPVSNVTTVDNSVKHQGRGIHEPRFAEIITGQKSSKPTKPEGTPEQATKKQKGRGTYEDRFAEIITGQKSPKTTKPEGTPAEVTSTQTAFSPRHGAREANNIYKHQESGKGETLDSYLASQQDAFRRVIGDDRAKIALENDLTMVITVSTEKLKGDAISKLQKAIQNNHPNVKIYDGKDSQQVMISAPSKGEMERVVQDVVKGFSPKP